MPPGVQASRPEVTKLAPSSITAPSASAAAPRAMPEAAPIRKMPRASRGRDQQREQARAKVALWVATAKPISAISAKRSHRRSAVVGEDQKVQRQHREAGEDVGQQDAGEPRQGGAAPTAAR